MKPNVQEIPFAKINRAPYNPRKRLTPNDHEYQVIKNSMKEFGLVEVLVWNKRTSNLVSGHTRMDILMAEGEKSGPCVVVDLPEDKERALNITLNNPHVSGSWDDVALANLLREIEQGAPDMYDSLDMAPLTQEVDLPLRGGMDDTEEEPDLEEGIGPPEMELQPYEHYDYIVLMFKDARDFLAAQDHFKLKKVAVPGFVGKKTIGLGRVVDGGAYVKRVQAEKAESAPKKK
jgi:hypothetical protein